MADVEIEISTGDDAGTPDGGAVFLAELMRRVEALESSRAATEETAAAAVSSAEVAVAVATDASERADEAEQAAVVAEDAAATAIVAALDAGTEETPDDETGGGDDDQGDEDTGEEDGPKAPERRTAHTQPAEAPDGERKRGGYGAGWLSNR